MQKLKIRCLIATILATICFILFFSVTSWTLIIPMIKTIHSWQDLTKTFEMFPFLPYWGIFALCLICDFYFLYLARLMYVLYRQIYTPLLEYNKFILKLADNKIPERLAIGKGGKTILAPLGNALNLVRDRLVVNLNRLHQSQEREESLKKTSETTKYLKSIVIGRLTPDIRMPLQSIKGYDEIMRTKSSQNSLTEADIKKYSAGIQRNVDTIDALIAQIVKFIEIDTVGPKTVLSSVSTADLIQDVMKICQRHCQEREVTLNTLFSSSMPEKLIVNEDFFVQALLIVVRAVFRASEHGENLYIYSDSDDDKVYIHVRDSRKSPCRESLSSSYNNFNRKSATFEDYKTLSTTVLGLFFIEFELEKIGGKLLVESNEYAYNEVVMVFNKVDIFSTANNRKTDEFACGAIYQPKFDASEENEAKVTDSDSHYRVLVCEDNHDNATVIGEMLELYNFQVVAKGNSHEIIKTVSEESFDGIILSNSMRHKHLLCLIEDIHLSDKNKHTPIAVVASKINQQKKKELKSLGVSFIMLKPINFVIFINKLKHFIYYAKLNKAE